MSSAVSAPVRKLDPVKFEVIRNALVEATEEMAARLRRSAYSTNIKTRADFSCVIFDEQLRCLAPAFAQPTHLGSMYRMVPMAVRDYGPENLGPGDAILVNDPYLGGVHLNDITIISPVYHDGRASRLRRRPRPPRRRRRRCAGQHRRVPRGLPGGRHHPAGQAGVRRARSSTTSSVWSSTRSGRSTRRPATSGPRSRRSTPASGGSGSCSTATATRRSSFYIDELIEYTERRTRAGSHKLPQGVYRGRGSVDNDGFTDDPVRLVADGRRSTTRASSST